MSKINIVSGPPCSGKSTYVREHIGQNDVRFDYDTLMECVTCRDARSEPSEEQKNFIFRMRGMYPVMADEAGIDAAWIIATRPTDKLIELCGDNSEVIRIDATEEECYANLENDDSRIDKDAEREKIRKYFEKEDKQMEQKSKHEPMRREIRSFGFEVRARQDEEHGNFIEGRAIVFGAPTDMGTYTEIIDDGALDATDLRDVRMLINHNTDMIPLARSRNNNANSTMQLSVVPGGGLDIRSNLDTENNADAKSLYSACSRGDITGMSFMFTVDSDIWENIESDHPTRHIRSISKVFEVSAVTFPAYEQTSLEARGLADALDSAAASLESARARAAEEKRGQELALLNLLLEVD